MESDDFEHIVDKILKGQPNLVLLDINLPYYDGYYVCRELRGRSNVPIIVVTSRKSDMDELMSMNLGSDIYSSLLSKSIIVYTPECFFLKYKINHLKSFMRLTWNSIK